MPIPGDLDFDQVDGLSNEIRQKLNEMRPTNLASGTYTGRDARGAITASCASQKARAQRQRARRGACRKRAARPQRGRRDRISLSDTQTNQLIGYVDLMEKWNRAFNLTAVRRRSELFSRHIFESLAVKPYIREKWADIGTGAGHLVYRLQLPSRISRSCYWIVMARKRASCWR